MNFICATYYFHFTKGFEIEKYQLMLYMMLGDREGAPLPRLTTMIEKYFILKKT
jgi:hypothetical protein